jgi:hypothetical protein
VGLPHIEPQEPQRGGDAPQALLADSVARLGARGLTLRPNEELRLFATDLTEMFYSFAITAVRARSNCLPIVCTVSELSGTRAEAAYWRDTKDAAPDDLVLLSLFTEPIGDINAVDYAQEAHANVLVAAGAWQPHLRVESWNPLPRDGSMELLTVDDHLGIVKVRRQPTATRSSRQHPRVRGVSRGIILFLAQLPP